MRGIYLLAGSLLWAASSQAQGLPGYILTLQGDTLRGVVTEQGQQQTVRLYTPGTNQPQTFQADQIQGYGLQGRPLIRAASVRTAPGPTVRRFVIPRQLGRVSLFAYTTESGLLLQPAATDTLYELSATNWHVLLNRHLHGCAAINHTSSRMLQLPFQEKTVQQVFTEYNSCVDTTWQQQPQPRQALWLQGLGVQLGYHYTTEGSRESRNPATGSTRLAGLEWTGLRASGLQASIGLQYAEMRLEDEFARVPASGSMPDQDKKNRYQLDFMTLDLHLTQRFGRGRGPGLLLSMGGGFNYQLRSRGETITITPNSTVPPATLAFYTEGFTGMGGHVSGGVGVVLPLATRHELRLQAQALHYFASSLNSVGGLVTYTLFRR